MPITKAIIPVAGWGTRRLPITKSIEKCMLPIGNRPIVDYIVKDCIKAGVTDIFFVVSEGSTQLQQYYTENEQLNQYLQYNGQPAMQELAHPPAGVNFHFIEQTMNGKYGTAVPVALCVPHLLKGESVIVALGDCFFHSTDNSSEVMRLKTATPEGGNSMLAVEVPHEETSRYGVVQFNEDNGAFERIIEHPQPDQAPSNYINSGTFIINYDVLMRIYSYCNQDLSGEYWMIEPLNQYVLDKGVVQVVPAQGQYLDGGNVHGWLHANEVIIKGAR
jgi:UTP--glucose-1-phosphate uridylyltransferase